MSITKNIWPFRIAIAYLFLVVVLGFFAPLIATDFPYKLRVEDETYYPAWRQFLAERNIKAYSEQYRKPLKSALTNNQKRGIIPFSATFIDLEHTQASAPGAVSTQINKRHILGTDAQGKDVLSGLIHGAHISMKVSFIGSFLALFFAFILAIPPSYFGNRFFKLNRLGWVLSMLIVLLLYLFFFKVGLVSFIDGPQIIIYIFLFIFLVLLLLIGLRNLSFFRKGKMIYFPFDSLMMRFLEFFKSVPTILILLVLIALLPRQTIMGLTIIISLLIWANFYRYIRAAILEKKEEDFNVSLLNLGYSHTRILLVHYIPSIIRSILIPFIITMISIILFEATLSFLGIGVEEGVVTWGKLLADARSNFSAWWLALFPGGAIFLLVVSLNIIGDNMLHRIEGQRTFK